MRKLYIVKEHKDFDKIIQMGNVYQNLMINLRPQNVKLKKSSYYVIYYDNNNLPYDRFGISVGKKIGNAVYRNKHKRKLRAIIDNYKKMYVNSKDYIIILRGSAKNIPYLELNDDFLKIMNNIRKEILNEEKK